MNLHEKFELEKRTFKKFIEYYKNSKESHAIAMVIAYETGLQAIEELYEVSQQVEEPEMAPF